MAVWTSALQDLALGWYGFGLLTVLASAGRSIRGNRVDVVQPASPDDAVDAELHRLAKGLSHDLSGPLRSVGIALTMVEEDLARGAIPEAQHTVTVVREQAEHLSRMTHSLVEYCRTAWQPYPQQKTDLRALVQATVHQTWPTDAPALQLQIPARVVTLEQGALKTVLQVLLDNARTHRGDEGPGKVAITMYLNRKGPDEGWLVVTVDDDGQGVPREMHDAVFAIFRRSTTTAKGGGMGLSLAQTLTWRHGGHIEMNHSPQGGTRVSVRWPLPPTPPPQAIP
jgi:signal transduction histidine kinase